MSSLEKSERTPSEHHELASALLALYTTMDALALLGSGEDDGIWFPPHPENMFNVELALEAGFTHEAIDAMLQIPYFKEYGIEILPWTDPVSWLCDDAQLHQYEEARGMLPHKYDDEEDLMEPSCIRICSTQGIGHAIIYDAETKLVHSLEPYYMSAPLGNYRDVPGKPPGEVFGPIIASFQKLENLGEIGAQLIFGPEGCQPWAISEDMTEEDRKQTMEVNEMIEGIWQLKSIYLECGWDVEAEGPAQATFRREEFVARRKDHFDARGRGVYRE